MGGRGGGDLFHHFANQRDGFCLSEGGEGGERGGEL